MDLLSKKYAQAEEIKRLKQENEKLKQSLRTIKELAKSRIENLVILEECKKVLNENN